MTQYLISCRSRVRTPALLLRAQETQGQPIFRAFATAGSHFGSVTPEEPRPSLRTALIELAFKSPHDRRECDAERAGNRLEFDKIQPPLTGLVLPDVRPRHVELLRELFLREPEFETNCP